MEIEKEYIPTQTHLALNENINRQKYSSSNRQTNPFMENNDEW